jgi:hypothetical protein
MILDLFKSQSKPQTAFPRCQHLSPAGRQCSQPVCSTSLHFCFTHKTDPDQLLIAELTEAAGALSTPEEIHNFLKKVTLLRIQGRLTPKESGNYTYLCQFLQRGLRDIAYHQKLRQDQAEHEAEQASLKKVRSWSIPRPDRSDPSDDLVQPAPAEPPISSVENAPERSSSPVSNQPNDTFVGAGLACPESSRRARPLFDAAHTISPGPTTIAGGPTPTETTPPKKSNQTPKSPAPSTTSKLPRPSESFTPPLVRPTTANAAPANHTTTDSGPARRSRDLCGEGGSSLPPDFYNHFHPIDPSIPPHLQDKNKNVPHPDAAECARLNARRGFPNSRLYRNAASRLSTFWRR